MRRLVILLTTIMLATAAHADPEIEFEGSWKIKTEVDPFTDKKKVIANATSSTEDDYNQLILRCWNDEFDIYIANGILGEFKSTRVGMRIGEAKPTFSRWIGSTDMGALFARKPIQLAKEFLESEATRLVFRLERDDKTETSVFDLDGFGVAYQKTIEACGG